MDPIANRDQEDMKIRDTARRAVIFFEEIRLRGVKRIDATPFLMGWFVREFWRERDLEEKEE